MSPSVWRIRLSDEREKSNRERIASHSQSFHLSLLSEFVNDKAPWLAYFSEFFRLLPAWRTRFGGHARSPVRRCRRPCSRRPRLVERIRPLLLAWSTDLASDPLFRVHSSYSREMEEALAMQRDLFPSEAPQPSTAGLFVDVVFDR